MKATIILLTILTSQLIYADSPLQLTPLTVLADPEQRLSPPSAFYQRHQELDSDVLQRMHQSTLGQYAIWYPGIQPERLSAGTGEDYSIRGFATGGRLLLDGLLDNQSHFQRDLSTIESIEFTRGHNSVLFGAGAPGGSVNFIAKHPLYDDQQSLLLSVGSNDYHRLALDSNALLNRQYSLAGRTIFTIHKDEGWKANATDRQTNWLNSLAWRYHKGEIRASWEYSDQHYPYDFDNVFANGAPIYNVSYIHPDSDAQRVYHQLNLQQIHRFSPVLELDGQLRIIQGERTERQIGFYYLRADDKPMPGFYQLVDESFQQRTLRLALSSNSTLGIYPQKVTAGLSHHSTHTDSNNQRAISTFSLDIYQPDFRIALPSADQLLPRQGAIDWKEAAAFAQYHLEPAPSLSLVIGGRYSRYQLDSTRNDYPLATTNNQHTSYASGLRWQAFPQLLVYSSYTQSWLPNQGTTAENSSFPPSLGTQKELGLQWTTDAEQSLELAAFDIYQSNLLARDPLNPGYKIPVGSKRVQGVELSFHSRLSQQWYFNITASWQDPRIRHNPDGYESNRFAGVPSQAGSIQLSYTPAQDWSGLLTVSCQGKRQGDMANSFQVTGYCRYDAALQWQLMPDTHLNMSIHNLTNRHYVSTVAGADFLRFGDQRYGRLSLTYTF